MVLLGGGRALLMQLAMPGVAAGVDEHSDFRRRPFRRLLRTLRLTYRLAFGTPVEVAAAAAAINRAHRRVEGAGYSARDPRLLLWVHATLVDSALVAYEAFVAPLTPAEREGYYQGSLFAGPLLGIPREWFPPNFTEFREYVAGVLEREARVDARAVALGWRVLRPTDRLPAAAFAPLVDITSGLLPPGLRRAYGLPEPGRWWEFARRWLPPARAAAPRLLWEMPEARRARRRPR